MDSLQVTDAASAAVATHPRVALADINAAIKHRFDMTADKAVKAADHTTGFEGSIEDPIAPLTVLSICILVMHNGFTVIGKAAPASPENFNRELGRQYAYEDAVRQLWPLMGFALRDRLSCAPANAAA